MRAVDREARGARDVQAGRPLLHHHVGGDRLGPEPGAVFLGGVDRRPVDVADQPRQQHHLRHAVGLRDPGSGIAGDDVHLRGRSLAGPRPRRLEVHLVAAEDVGDVAVARLLQRVAAQPDDRPLVGERRLHSPVGMDAAVHRQRGDAGRGRPRPQRLRRFGGDDLAHAVHGDAPRRTRTRSRSTSARRTR